MGAARTSRAPPDGLDDRLDVLADFFNDDLVRAEDLDADVGPHAGGEHFDAVDDGLGEDVAPAGNLDNARHFIVDQVSLRSALALPEENAILERLFQVRTQCPKGLQRFGFMRFAELRPDRMHDESLGLVSFGGASQKTGSLGALDGFLNRVPGVGLDPLVEEFPVDLVNLTAPELQPLGVDSLQHFSAERFRRGAKEFKARGQGPSGAAFLYRQSIAGFQPDPTALEQGRLISGFFLVGKDGA